VIIAIIFLKIINVIVQAQNYMSKMPPDAISELLFLKIFQGICPQTPLAVACYAC